MTDPFRAELIALLPRLKRFALGLTGHPQQAEDLVQAGCERALVRQAQWQPGTRLDSWMFKIMQNLWIDQLRAHRPQPFADPEELANVPEDQDWQRRMEARLTLEQVMQAMQRLSPPMRAVLALVCVEGLSYQEAADTLAVPIGTVMSRLSRARIELMRQLSPPADAGGSRAALH
jgi:RNA polymerase sigma-70 factor, ECF subfamily